MTPPPPFAKAARFMVELKAPDMAQADDPRPYAVDPRGRTVGPREPSVEAFDLDPDAAEAPALDGKTASRRSNI